MRALSIQKTAIALLILAASAGVAVAQPASEAQEPSELAKEDAAPADAGAMSPEEILADAHKKLDTMEATGDNMNRMLRSARQDKDVVKVLCLDDKLNQMNVTTRSASSRVDNIEAAVASGNNDRLAYDSEVLSALSEHGAELAVEANQCIGEESGQVEDSELKVTVDPAIPKEDTTSLGTNVLLSAPPVAASPTI